MEIQGCLERIVNSLGEQGYVFSKGVKIYYTDADRLESIKSRFVDPLNFSCFQGDMYRVSQELPEIVLLPWTYVAPKPIFYSIFGETQGLLSIVGIVMISDLSQIDIKSVFDRFDDAVMNVLRRYPWGDDNKTTFGTLMCLFSHTEDAQCFNIGEYYSAHAFKLTYVSTISIDCEAEAITRGRAGIFSHKWRGGMDVSKLKECLQHEGNVIKMYADRINISNEALEEENKKVLVIEMEEIINQMIPNAQFKYPADYWSYDGIIGIVGWSFPKGNSFIKEQLDYLRRTFGVNNLVPFAIDIIGDEREPMQYACFLIDGINNNKVVIVYPFGSKETFYQEQYDNIDEWFNAERIDIMISNIMTLNGRPKCLGIDMFDDEACGPVVAIPKRLLYGCRLIMTTDACVAYAENGDIKNVVEKYGFGLRVLSVREIENENVEAVMETTDVIGEKPGTICIEGVEANLPDNAYILATPFAGEFFIKLETEDSNGNREFLWADDYIYK